jgi:AcrR family transcriptional regulator
MTRRRGRPPKSEDVTTRERLLDAAAAACVDVGFDAVTLADLAARAGVTPAAIYNHFADKAELLYTAGRIAIDRLGGRIAPSDDPARGAHDVVAAFLAPDFRASRRLILELHLAGTRHPELGEHLRAWHREFAKLAVDRAPDGDDASAATVKALFLLLLGICHVDDLEAIEATPAALAARIDRIIDALYGR